MDANNPILKVEYVSVAGLILWFQDSRRLTVTLAAGPENNGTLYDVQLLVRIHGNEFRASDLPQLNRNFSHSVNELWVAGTVSLILDGE